MKPRQPFQGPNTEYCLVARTNPISVTATPSSACSKAPAKQRFHTERSRARGPMRSTPYLRFPPTVTLSQQADRRPSKAANEAASVPGATEKGPRFLMRYSPHSLVASTQLKMQNGCEKSAVIHGKAGKQRSTETGQSGREEPPVGGRRRWKRKRYW